MISRVQSLHSSQRLQRIMLVHWGQSGGGTRFHYELSAAMTRSHSGCALSFNQNSDQAQAMGALAGAADPFMLRTYGSKIGVVAGVPRLLINAIRFRKHLRSAEVTHVVSSMESVYQSLVIPLVLPRNIHYASIIHDAAQHPGDEHWVKRIGRRLELWRANVVITLSQDVATRLTDAHPGIGHRVRTLFHPAFPATNVDCVRHARTISSGRPPVIGHFGRLLPYKGIGLLLEAASYARAQGTAISVKIVGDGPDACLRNTEVGASAEWSVGWVDESEVDAVIDSFDVLSATYVEASQSGVIAHAMSLGVPVLGTPVGGISRQISEPGIGLVAEDISAESVGRALAELLKPETYERCSAAGLIAAEQLSWPEFCRALQELLNEESSATPPPEWHA